MVSRSATSNGRHYYISRSEEFNNESAPAQSCDHQHQQQGGGLHPTNVVASQTEESTLVEGIIDLTPRLELKVSVIIIVDYCGLIHLRNVDSQTEESTLIHIFIKLGQNLI